MNKTLATSLTTATFLIIAISGIMMFFHFFDNSVKSLHEFLGLAFIVAALFHLFYNWKSMKSYFNKKTFFASIVAGIIVTTVFVVNDSNKQGNPKQEIIMSVLKAPTTQSYEILNIKNAKVKLKNADIENFEGNSIMKIAKANHMSPFELLGILTAKE